MITWLKQVGFVVAAVFAGILFAGWLWVSAVILARLCPL